MDHSPKRKSTAQIGRGNGQHSKIPTTDRRQTFPFLKLPDEIRDCVYQQVISECRVLLVDGSYTATRLLVVASSITSLSRVTRCEFYEELRRRATKVFILVKDFDFGFVQNWLLGPETPPGNAGKRVLQLDIVTCTIRNDEHLPRSLMEWFEFVKRGNGHRFAYTSAPHGE